VKPLVELSIEHHELLLKYANESSPLYFRLKNAVKTEANTIAVLCDLEEAEMLRSVAQHFCPNALPQIEKDLLDLDTMDLQRPQPAKKSSKRWMIWLRSTSRLTTTES
jgi:hypothetical protein